jgi:hypothetical protein
LTQTQGARIPLFAFHSPICSQLDSSAPAVTPVLLYGGWRA